MHQIRLPFWLEAPPRTAQKGARCTKRASYGDREGRAKIRRRMGIALKRAYEAPAPEDGCRILVERLWPRGLTKEAARIDLWARDAAPSSELRRWFAHEPSRWQGFRRRYFAELEHRPEALAEIRRRARAGPVTFVFASRETELNSAVALRDYLERGAQKKPEP